MKNNYLFEEENEKRLLDFLSNKTVSGLSLEEQIFMINYRTDEVIVKMVRNNLASIVVNLAITLMMLLGHLPYMNYNYFAYRLILSTILSMIIIVVIHMFKDIRRLKRIKKQAIEYVKIRYKINDPI